jgi:hypothetical protein
LEQVSAFIGIRTLLIIPVFFGAWAIDWFQNRPHSLKQIVLSGSLFLYCGLATAFVLWPLLWIDPFLLFKAVQHFSGEFSQFRASYLGQLFQTYEMPWHYTSVHLLAVTPLPLLVLIGMGMIFAVKQAKQKVFLTAMLGLWLTLPLLIRIYPGSSQYGGMRHVFLLVPALMLLAAVGLDCLLSMIKRRNVVCNRQGDRMRISPAPGNGISKCRCYLVSGTGMGAAAVIALMSWLSMENAKVHPYQGSYLNEGVRWLIPPDKLGSYFDFYSWGSLYHHGIKWLNANAAPGDRIYVPNERYLAGLYPLRSDLAITASEPADWILFPGWRRDLSGGSMEPAAFLASCQGGDLLLIRNINPSIPRIQYEGQNWNHGIPQHPNALGTISQRESRPSNHPK